MSQTPDSSSLQSPPGTPNLDLDFSQVKDLLLQCTPRKSGQELADLRAELAARIDDSARVLTHCKRRLVDLENEADDPRKRARRGRNHRTDGVEVTSPHFMAQELEERARRYGRKFVIVCCLWLALGTDDVEAFFATDLDDDYDPELRFAIPDDCEEHEPRQAQLREVADILPDDLKPFIKSPWFAKAFYDGMRSQLAHTRNRLRNDAPRYILPGLKDVNADADPETGERPDVNPSQLDTSASRLQHFAARIGLVAAHNKYSVWNVPLLHGNESAELDYDQVFRHPLLLMVRLVLVATAK
ncbi:hypothetical protein GGX14DRAFT_562594 [Mycena pura]|uniref:Uncharacterized protein n=1 Tax=Mycena pura TaxID=153505 RepID=A0AAD6VK37_9AGAR|nr:hypothetical protein GGX14DRAFT_562594 [Mycena pura]